MGESTPGVVVYAIPLTAVVISVITLIFGLLTLREKAGEREMTTLHESLRARVALMESDLRAIRQSEQECQRERQQLQRDNYQLTRDLLTLQQRLGEGGNG